MWIEGAQRRVPTLAPCIKVVLRFEMTKEFLSIYSGYRDIFR